MSVQLGDNTTLRCRGWEQEAARPMLENRVLTANHRLGVVRHSDASYVRPAECAERTGLTRRWPPISPERERHVPKRRERRARPDRRHQNQRRAAAVVPEGRLTRTSATTAPASCSQNLSCR